MMPLIGPHSLDLLVAACSIICINFNSESSDATPPPTKKTKQPTPPPPPPPFWCGWVWTDFPPELIMVLFLWGVMLCPCLGIFGAAQYGRFGPIRSFGLGAANPYRNAPNPPPHPVQALWKECFSPFLQNTSFRCYFHAFLLKPILPNK